MTGINKAASNPAPGFVAKPDYSITTADFSGRVQVYAGGQMLADSHHAILLTETDMPPVYYFPKDDVNFGNLQAVDKTTYCPFKGHANYWRISGQEAESGPAVWGYAEPYEEVAYLDGYVAFYANRVEIRAKIEYA
ncbi:MAG: DUF427 domain-containing protein [Kordiimonadaceae bacterium]|nr:DUF427 domain-containing protein [Kordiimonadaceae bacterium]